MLKKVKEMRVFDMGGKRVDDSHFVLNERLLASTHFICDLPLCRLLRHDDARYPWFLLVPRLLDVVELYALSTEQQNQIMAEISLISRFLKDVLGVYKINVGALGNIVPQLHIHVIGREMDDATWPAPVWGIGKADPLLPLDVNHLIGMMHEWLEMQ